MSEMKYIGIVGDGQLGRMMTEAAEPLGYEVSVLGQAGIQSPAAQVGAHQVEGGLKDPDAIRRLVGSNDVTTWEIEHIDAMALRQLGFEGHNIQPSPSSLQTIQDKHRQKTHLKKHGIEVADFMSLKDWKDLVDAREMFDDQFVVKTRTGGYDGRGNARFRANMTWDDILTDLKANPLNPQLYAERLVDFQRELSLIGVRDLAGHVAVYPVVETIHEDNICVETVAPADGNPAVLKAAEELGRATIETFNGAGVFAVEMFQDKNDNVVVNEVAPRVHNSGHWTIIGADTSQFENHIRAITGMPLGSTAAKGPTAMVNILGTKECEVSDEAYGVLAGPNAEINWYGKSSRPARKIGHISVRADTTEDALSQAHAIRAQIEV
jgi:5-(carboxyamino)imidazole ribonucleotide synthase